MIKKHFLKLSTLIVLVGACLMLTQCAVQTGSSKLAEAESKDINQLLVKGKPTRTEVEAVFGEPSDTDVLPDGRIKCVYIHTKHSAMARNYIPVVNWFSSGTDDTTKKLVILFKDDVVDVFTTTTSQGETKGGLLGG